MKYDLVIVPGGGLRQGGELPLWVQRRFDLAIQLHDHAPILALSAGTPHRPPPYNEQGFPIFEASAGARYLIRWGVPANRILVETHSWDTIGNAWFSRVIHADPCGFERLLVINSEFHMPRTELIFQWVYGLTPRRAFQLEFRTTPDDGMDPAARRARIKRERRSIEATRILATRITEVAAFHRWLFTEHHAYNAEANACRTAISAEERNAY